MIADVFGLFTLTLCIIKVEKARYWLFDKYFSIFFNPYNEYFCISLWDRLFVKGVSKTEGQLCLETLSKITNRN